MVQTRLWQKRSRSKPNEESLEVPNPAFELWKAQEQKVLSYLLTSIPRVVLVQIAALPSAAEV
jgi:hypothetical protein